jgi:hypothetical protein
VPQLRLVRPIKSLVSITLTFAVTIAPLFAASWLDRPPMPDQLLSNRQNIHQAVLALEWEPLHSNAPLVRALLLGHFKKVDYLICGDVLGPLTQTKALEPVMFQIVIASGDWVEEHPERARDISAYTLSGLESGVRAYKNFRAIKPGVKHKLMDELVGRYENNTLKQWTPSTRADQRPNHAMERTADRCALHI